ncbi:hypothetical protein F5Y16DRAFT_393534 [Xylariaceae sp. FL0255]|nr:hypothetical protein F5Y16DRAFT_393534 [Xylariaceae sp. FL0255]
MDPVSQSPPSRVNDFSGSQVQARHIGDSNDHGIHNISNLAFYICSWHRRPASVSSDSSTARPKLMEKRYIKIITAAAVLIAILALVVTLPVLKKYGKLESSSTSAPRPTNTSIPQLTNTPTPQPTSTPYCANDTNCNFAPNSSDYVHVGQNGSLYTWEKANQSVTFTSGVTFNWSIDSSEASAPNYTVEG